MSEHFSDAVQCSILDTTWKNVIAEPTLPAEEGAKITLKCPVSNKYGVPSKHAYSCAKGKMPFVHFCSRLNNFTPVPVPQAEN